MSTLSDALRGRAVHGYYLVQLPPPVSRFFIRAWRRRAELDDVFSLGGATKPRELLPLLKAASGLASAIASVVQPVPVPTSTARRHPLAALSSGSSSRGLVAPPKEKTSSSSARRRHARIQKRETGGGSWTR